MPRTKKTDPVEATVESQVADAGSPTEPDLAQTIADRYYGVVGEIAPAIASEFWSRLDQAVAAEIVAQRPGGNGGHPPAFLASLREGIANVEYPDATTRALASKGGLL